MHPIFVRFADITLHTYGVLLAAGFLLAVWLAVRQARKVGLDPNQIMDLSFYVLLAAIIGSRVFYVLGNLEEYRQDPVAIFKFWQGGLVFYGGLIFAFPVGLWYARKYKLDFRLLADVMAPSIALGQTLGRLGCFAAGCCYGAPAAVPWACTFHDPGSLAPLNIALHPTQLYESAATLAIFLTLLVMRGAPRFQGKIFWYYLLFYSVARFVIEFYRDDPRGWAIAGAISTAQAIGIPAFALAVFMLLRKRSEPPRKAADSRGIRAKEGKG